MPIIFSRVGFWIEAVTDGAPFLALDKPGAGRGVAMGGALLGCWERRPSWLAAALILVSRNLYWIWFVGSAAWFLDAALVLHRGALGRGVLAGAVSAMFLAAGMFFKKQAGR